MNIDQQCHELAEQGRNACIAVDRWDWRKPRCAEGDVPAKIANRIIALRTREAQSPRRYGEAFCIEQDESDGSTYADNVQCVTDSGRMVGLRRPLNSRSSWPLMASLYDTDEVSVFDDAGNPTPEFLAMGETP